VAHFLLSLPVWWINGLLVCLYFLAGRLAELVSLLCALAIAVFLDPPIQQRASPARRQDECAADQVHAPTATWFTLLVLGIWLAASELSSTPIPAIGAGLWITGLVSLLAVSEERFNQQWWVKSGILAYAFLVLLLRYGLLVLTNISPSAWASVLGGSADASLVLDQTRSNVALLGMLFVLVLYPLGYAAVLFNRFLRNPKPLYNLGQEAGEVIRRMRMRS
jgi:hypothetical protein